MNMAAVPGVLRPVEESPPPAVEIGRGWTLWPLAMLRSTGFPVTIPDSLRAPEAVQAANNFVEAEKQLEKAAAQVLACEALRETKPRIRKRRPIAASAAGREGAVAVQGYNEALAVREQALQVARAAAEAGIAHSTEALRSIIEIPRLRAAITWQSPEVAHNALEALRGDESKNASSKTRRRERVLARYIYRYCFKNETVGFFGPIGWATFNASVPGVNVVPGPELISQYRVEFEYWAVAAVADAIGAMAEYRPWLKPRLHPQWRLVRPERGGGPMLAGLTSNQLPLPDYLLLAHCDGRTRAVDIAERLVRDHPQHFGDREAVYAQFDAFAQRRILLNRLVAPFCNDPMGWLHQEFAALPDAALRDALLARIDSLTRIKLRASHTRDPAALADAMRDLDAAFAAASGQSARRAPGESYAGRTPLFLDSLRDVRVELGAEFTKRLAAPLGLLLQSGRWATAEVGRRYAKELDQAFIRARGTARGGAVPFGLWRREMMNRRREIQDMVDEVVRDFRGRWSAILDPRPEQNELALACADVRGAVAETFRAEAPGWAAARHHSPDVFVLAANEAELRAGRFDLVLGEMHAGANSLWRPFSALFHPDAEGLTRRSRADIGWDQFHSYSVFGDDRLRMLPRPQTERDWQLASDASLLTDDPSRVLNSAALEVVSGADGLTVKDLAGRGQWPAQLLLEPFIRYWFFHAFRFSLEGTHVPRIRLDRVVIHREAWRFRARTCEFASADGAADRFIGAQRWAADHRLPRHVFAWVPGETKPLYVDLHAPPSVDLFTAAVRGAAELSGDPHIRVEEMLPAPEHAWLRDAQGARYSCELRLLAVDPVAWAPKRRHAKPASPKS